MEPCIVFIESNTSGTGKQFVSAARSLGLQPVLFAEDPSRYSYAQQEAVQIVQHSCVDNLDGLERSIARLAGERKLAGIYSSSEYFIETAAQLAQHFGLPGPAPAAVRICRNKWEQRRRLQQAGVGVPAFICVNTAQQAVEALDSITLPVVLKPTYGTGSIGVRLCRSVDEVRCHAAALLAVHTNERGMPVPQEVLVEEYLTWPEFSAEVFGTTVVGFTRKHVSREPYFVETGHDFPALFTADVRDKLSVALTCAMRAVGMDWGPMHIEFRCAEDRFAVMEINPRLAGGFIPELLRLATGIDVISETIKLVAGLQPDLTPSTAGHASIRFICPQSDGTITRVKGLEQATALDGIASALLYRQIGDSFAVHHDFRDRVGHVVSVADCEHAAVQVAESARNMIEIHVAPQ